MKVKPKVAIIGTRGVPARYGGFETFAEELGRRLCDLDYEVRVYGRKYHSKYPLREEAEYLRIKSILLPAVKHKYFETPLHSLFAFFDLILNRVDCVILCNAANSPFAFIVRLLGIPLLINVDGIEKERRKWNIFGKIWYALGEACSSLFASRIITDADYIDDYYRDRFGVCSAVIRYGARVIDPEIASKKIKDDYSFLSASQSALLDSYGVKAGEYILYVSRLEPENNADKVIKAYSMLPKEVRLSYPLVIVGDAPYAKEYKKLIQSLAPEEVKFLGYRFSEEYEALQLAAFVYIQATEVGGTHPALVEAMGFANYIIANDVPEHRETIDETGIYYDFNDIDQLHAALRNVIEHPEGRLELKSLAFKRSVDVFSWEAVTAQYVELIDSTLKVDNSRTS